MIDGDCEVGALNSFLISGLVRASALDSQILSAARLSAKILSAQGRAGPQRYDDNRQDLAGDVARFVAGEQALWSGDLKGRVNNPNIT
jgi:hypothetical protein